MADAFAGYATTPTSPAVIHTALSANAGADLDPIPCAIYCQADGTITIQDKAGTARAYAMTAGTHIPFRGVRIAAINGGTFYGWS